MKIAALFCVFISLVPFIVSVEDLDSEEHIFRKFQKFIKKYEKHYSTINELQEKYLVFQENYLNMLKQREGEMDSSVLGITEYMDMTNEEFNLRYRSTNVNEGDDVEGDIDIVEWDEMKPPIELMPNDEKDNKTRTLEEKEKESKVGQDSSVTALPENFDWRDKGVVASVIDQGVCGSCWAFSALVAVEASYAKKYKKILNFSPQQILDCNESGYNCSGGTIVSSMRYLKVNGAMSLRSYPYEEKQKKCRYQAETDLSKAPRVKNFYKGSNISETLMKQMLYHGGPLAININSEYFKYYKKGILAPSSCSVAVDHGVAIVGYGVSGKHSYWIIKNSWGPSFGEKGYIRILRGKGLCGLNTTVVGAIVK